MRKRVEELFGEAKEFMGLRQAKFRRSLYVQEQVLLTASAQNIKRMARLLSKRGPKRETAMLALIPREVSESAYRFIDWIFCLRQVERAFARQPA